MSFRHHIRIRRYADAKFVKPADGALTATLTAQGTRDTGKSAEDRITVALNLTAASRLVDGPEK